MSQNASTMFDATSAQLWGYRDVLPNVCHDPAGSAANSTLMPAALIDDPETSRSGYGVAVLTALNSTVNKRYFLDAAGKVSKENYQNAYRYNVEVVQVRDIHELGGLIERHSADARKLLIRGLPNGAGHRVRRVKVEFYEPEQGVGWVMLDIDAAAVPEGMDPNSLEAAEYIIGKLPPAFQTATYFYQFSSSAGILREDGTPLKAGISIHFFFFLSHPVRSKVISAYICQHCMDSGFFELGPNRGGVVELVWGVDPAPIRSYVQPHFIASPTIEEGVACVLPASLRQGFVFKASDMVQLPPLADAVIAAMKRTKRSLVDQYKRQHGYVTRRMHTMVNGTVAVTSYSVAPGASPAEGRRGRPFARAELSDDGKFLTLYFGDEGSPGSWYVSKAQPQLARRHGDGSVLPLKEISTGAHEYVRDNLKWFEEVPHVHLDLVNGYLPALVGFASAKVSLVLAPTGSGKSTATVAWTQGQMEQQRLVLYSAPTIVLVKQMQADYRAAGLHSHYYEDFNGDVELPRTGVIVSTVHSLPKLLKKAAHQGIPHVIVFDEIHLTLDEVHSSGRTSEFEQALSRSRQSLLLTGTLTDVQAATIVEFAKRACGGGITAADYCCYEFAPVKRNPLHILPLSRFDFDLVKLLQGLQVKHQAGEELPRVVLLMDTSRMEPFRILLQQFALEEVATVVSRPECVPSEIEAARISMAPILIASPLFALGLNAAVEPDIFWTRFDKLNVDTNQIIQTVNRANRGSVVAEVRIYGNVNAEAEFSYAPKEKIRAMVGDRIRVETSLQGYLEEHHHIDRVTYGELRESEKDSVAALSRLVLEDAIQNYRVVPLEGLAEVDKALADNAKAARKQARQAEESIIQRLAAESRVTSTEAGIVALEMLANERHYQQRKTDPRSDREFEQQKAGVLMRMCDLPDGAGARKVSERKLLRLFGEQSPWISAQYDRRIYPDWAKVEAEKTDCIVLVVEALQALRDGHKSLGDVLAGMTRNKGLRVGFLALANDDAQFQRLNKQFEDMASRRARLRSKGGKAARAEEKQASLELFRDLVQPLGVGYAQVDKRGRDVDDLERPIIPQHWNMEAMLQSLRRQALRLRSLPAGQTVPMMAPGTSSPIDQFFAMSMQVCGGCVFQHQLRCALGQHIDNGLQDCALVMSVCFHYQPLPPELKRA